MQKDRYIYNETSDYPSFISSGTRRFEGGELHVKRIFPAFAILFIYEGVLHIQEGRLKYDIKAGQWLMLSPYNLHYGYKTSHKRVSYYWVHFMPSENWEIRKFTDKVNPSIEIKNNGSGVYKPIFSMSLPMSGFSNTVIYEIIENLIEKHETNLIFESQAIFLKLLETMIDQNPKNSQDNMVVNDIISYMLNNFMEKDFSLEKVAQNFNFTRQYVTRMLKDKTGMSFLENLMDFRIEYAKNHLSIGNKTISEISNDLGYEDVAVFSRMFKSQVGISPRKYIAQQKDRFMPEKQ